MEDPEVSSDANRDARVEANKATVRRMLERLSAGDVDGFTVGLAPGYVRHCQAMPPELQEIRGGDAMSRWLLSNQTTFPDYHEELEWMVGRGASSRGARGAREHKAGRSGLSLQHTSA
jgi:ketosteroid isomerase-like protein